MKSNKNKIISLIAIITIILTLIGATYAFFAPQVGGSTSSNSVVTSNTTDLLTFSINRDISFTVTQALFAENGENQSGDATATATLTPNSKTGTATRNYYLYLNIESNPFVYSAANTNHDPELMLQVFDGSNQLVTLTGLGTQKTIKGVTGYDITGVSGLKTLLDDHAISASNNTATIENWKVVITLINLDVNQNDNTGKTIEAEIIIRQDEIDETDLTLNVANLSENGCNQPTINCNGVTAVWNNKINQLEVTSLDDIGSCTITCETPSGTPLNTYITGLSGTTQGDGQVVLENGYRYEGKNPNNYLMFNNELWRIIGVFETEHDSNNDGTIDTTANLVKIIRNETLGSFAWNGLQFSSNDWVNSTLKYMLNNHYYDWNTYKSTIDSYCKKSSSFSSKCDFSVEGIQDGYREMIIKSKWYLGGGGRQNYYIDYTPDSVYGYERNSNATYSGRSISTLGYIGLLYESDYLYGVLATDCSRSKSHVSTYYATSDCAGKDWLFTQGSSWLLDQNSNNSGNCWFIHHSGYVDTIGSGSSKGIRPVLYLSPSVYKISGNGTIISPYIIGM